LLYSASLIPPLLANTYNTFKPLDQEEGSRAPHHVKCRHQASLRKPPTYRATRLVLRALKMASRGQEWKGHTNLSFSSRLERRSRNEMRSLELPVSLPYGIDSRLARLECGYSVPSATTSLRIQRRRQPLSPAVALLLLNRLTSTLLLVPALSLPHIQMQQLLPLVFLAPLNIGGSTKGPTADLGWRRFRSNLHQRTLLQAWRVDYTAGGATSGHGEVESGSRKTWGEASHSMSGLRGSLLV
jgi:hypothetical protein